jgi:hypothetical protein
MSLAVEFDAAHADDVAQDLDAQVRSKAWPALRGHARRGLAGRGAFQHVARVREVVFERACQVGVAGTRRSNGLMLGRIARFNGQLLFPVLPVAIDDLDGDGRTDGLAVAHAGKNVRLVGFNLHAAAAAVALLAAPQLAVDEVQIDGTPAGSPEMSAMRASPWDSPAVEKRIISF